MIADDCLLHQRTYASLQEDVYCDFELNQDKYAWVYEGTQHM